MAKCGRGNLAVDDLPTELRAQIDARLDVGQSPKALYIELGIEEHEIALRTFQDYATARRREYQRRIVADEIALFHSLLKLADIDREQLTEIQRIQLGAVLQAMTASEKATVRLNAVKALAIIREDQRRQEAHNVRMRIEAAKARLNEKATQDEQTGQKVISIEEVARMLESIDVGDQAA